MLKKSYLRKLIAVISKIWIPKSNLRKLIAVISEFRSQNQIWENWKQLSQKLDPKSYLRKLIAVISKIWIQKSYLRKLIAVISEIRSKIKSEKTDSSYLGIWIQKINSEKTDSSYLKNLDQIIISEKTDSSYLRIWIPKSNLRKLIAVISEFGSQNQIWENW